MNVKPTLETTRDISSTLRKYADEIDRIADRMEQDNDLSCASSVLNAISNCFGNLRLDLLAVRPLREYEREILKNND